MAKSLNDRRLCATGLEMAGATEEGIAPSSPWCNGVGVKYIWESYI